jgi:hypothetical protein
VQDALEHATKKITLPDATCLFLEKVE